MPHSSVRPLLNVLKRISSLLKKPERSGKPAIASAPIRNVQYVIGRYFLRPPMFRRSCSPASAWITEPGSEEEQRLEERVGVEMEDARGVRADAHGQEHVAELRHGRVREHAFDVVLHEADRAGHQRRRGTDARDDRQRLWCVLNSTALRPIMYTPAQTCPSFGHSGSIRSIWCRCSTTRRRRSCRCSASASAQLSGINCRARR